MPNTEGPISPKSQCGFPLHNLLKASSLSLHALSIILDFKQNHIFYCRIQLYSVIYWSSTARIMLICFFRCVYSYLSLWERPPLFPLKLLSECVVSDNDGWFRTPVSLSPLCPALPACGFMDLGVMSSIFHWDTKMCYLGLTPIKRCKEANDNQRWRPGEGWNNQSTVFIGDPYSTGLCICFSNQLRTDTQKNRTPWSYSPASREFMHRSPE